MSIHRRTIKEVIEQLEQDIKDAASSTEWDGEVGVYALLYYLEPFAEEIVRLQAKIEYLEGYCKRLDNRTFGSIVVGGPIGGPQK